jgi:hypothetical protein
MSPQSRIDGYFVVCAMGDRMPAIASHATFFKDFPKPHVLAAIGAVTLGLFAACMAHSISSFDSTNPTLMASPGIPWAVRVTIFDRRDAIVTA